MQDRSLEPVAFLEHTSSCWADHCEQVSGFLRLGVPWVEEQQEPIRHGVCRPDAHNSLDLPLPGPHLCNIHHGVRSLFDMGLRLFRKHLAAHPTVQSTTVTGLLQLIESERKVSCPLFQPTYLPSLRLAFCPPTGILPRPVFDLSSSMFGS